jgi:hypothetical protein
MTDPLSDTAIEHQYLLHAVWSDDTGTSYKHRVIHTTAFSAKELIERYIQQEHPQWLPEGTGKIGYVDGKFRMGSITVFKVEPESCDDRDQIFKDWLEGAKAAREVVDEQREREADMATLKAINERWGIK